MAQHTTLLIGLGNEQRGDDAIGLLIASRFKPRESPNLRVLGPSADSFDLIDAWKAADAVILVDAARSGKPPGTIHRIDATTQSIPCELFPLSTHDFGIAQAIELARVLGKLPPRVIVYGIEGENFDAGEQVTAAVERAAGEVESLVLEDIQRSHQTTRA